MKILVVFNSYKELGGEEIVVQEEIALLRDNGHTVEEYRVSNDAIQSVPQKIMVTLFTPYNFMIKAKFRKVLRECKPDIVHVHNFFPLLSPSIFDVTKKMGIPSVLTVHNYRLLCPGGMLLRDGKICDLCLKKRFAWPAIHHACYRKSTIGSLAVTCMNSLHRFRKTWLKKVDAVIFPSKKTQELYAQSGIDFPSEREFVKPHFTTKSQSPSQKSDNYLFVGRLSQEKGISALLQAFQGTSYKLQIIGDGPMRARVENACSEHSNIDLLGYKPHEEVFSYMQDAKALLLPAESYETFGLTVIEAFAMGTPVLCSDFGALGELISQGENGYTFEAGDSGSLRECVEKMEALSEESHKIMCQSAYDSYQSRYSSLNNYEQLMDIYRTILES